MREIFSSGASGIHSLLSKRSRTKSFSPILTKRKLDREKKHRDSRECKKRFSYWSACLQAVLVKKNPRYRTGLDLYRLVTPETIRFKSNVP